MQTSGYGIEWHKGTRTEGMDIIEIFIDEWIQDRGMGDRLYGQHLLLSKGSQCFRRMGRRGWPRLARGIEPLPLESLCMFVGGSTSLARAFEFAFEVQAGAGSTRLGLIAL